MMKQKLENYSKSEIIKAIRSVPKYMISGQKAETLVLDQLDSIRRDKIFAKAEMARRTSIDRMNEFFNWKKEMIEKHGKDGKVRIKDLPPIEIERGVKLEKAWIDSENARKSIEKEEDKYYG